MFSYLFKALLPLRIMWQLNVFNCGQSHVNNTPPGRHSRLSSTAVQYSWETVVWTSAVQRSFRTLSVSLVPTQIPLLRSTASLSNTSDALFHTDKWASQWMYYWWDIGSVCFPWCITTYSLQHHQIFSTHWLGVMRCSPGALNSALWLLFLKKSPY